MYKLYSITHASVHDIARVCVYVGEYAVTSLASRNGVADETINTVRVLINMVQ